MAEMRYNAITGDWVIIAPERALRPHTTSSRSARPTEPWLAGCPFCPGNEAHTGQERRRFSAGSEGWSVRCVDNLFPALQPQGAVERSGSDLREAMSGVGLHEVIVESDGHSRVSSRRSASELALLVEAYHDRFVAFYADPRVRHVVIFKNHGALAGASLEHPHSQIVGTPVLPAQVRERLIESLRYETTSGRCLYCAALAMEMAEGSRVVAQNEHFVAFIPYAALSPFHLWIFPRRHCASFALTTADERQALAQVLAVTLGMLATRLDDPDFNYVIRSLPPSEAQVGHFHWYLALVPCVSRLGGFELGTGMHLNPASPEQSAAWLRG